MPTTIDPIALPVSGLAPGRTRVAVSVKHLSKRFLHEEFFKRENVSANRDFLLSLHPSLVYHASQLWIAFEKHDLIQWRWHLRQLLEENAIKGQVSSEKAREALARWESFPNQIGSAEPSSTRPETVS